MRIIVILSLLCISSCNQNSKTIEKLKAEKETKKQRLATQYLNDIDIANKAYLKLDTVRESIKAQIKNCKDFSESNDDFDARIDNLQKWEALTDSLDFILRKQKLLTDYSETLSISLRKVKEEE